MGAATLAIALHCRPRPVSQRIKYARDRIIREFEAIGRPTKRDKHMAQSARFRQRGET